MFTDERTDIRTTDAGVIGILIAHLGAFGSGELTTSTIRYCLIFSILGSHRFNSLPANVADNLYNSFN